MRTLLAPVLACVLLTGGCATSSTRTADTPRIGVCEQRTAEVFVIRGEIDAELARCVRETLADTTRELALDSEGGDVEAALDIADLLAGRDLTMRVEGECNSSCANYFLPLARRVSISPNAMVLLHGSVDRWTIERWRNRRSEVLATQIASGRTPEAAKAAFASSLRHADATAARQDAFAARHGVRPGWLLYREPGSGVVPGLTTQPPPGRAILVEEPMMRSCLPNVEIDAYQDALERRWLRSLRRLGLRWASIIPSGPATCRP